MLPDTLRDKNVCIIGLGYVGLTLAVAMADAGFHVYGVERDQRILDSLFAERAHFSEVGLNDKLSEQIRKGRFVFANKIDPAWPTTVYIVTVGTPIGPDKRTQSESLLSVISAINGVMRPGDMVILRSTVLIGTTRETVKPQLDALNIPYDLAFCPERTLEGKALMELRSLPQIVGGVDVESTFRASQMFSFLTPAVVRVNDLETAEAVKLINNTQRDYIFAFANEVASLCEVIGISADLSPNFPPVKSRVPGFRQADPAVVSLFGRAPFLRPGLPRRSRRAQPGSRLAVGHRRRRREAALMQASTAAP